MHGGRCFRARGNMTSVGKDMDMISAYLRGSRASRARAHCMDLMQGFSRDTL